MKKWIKTGSIFIEILVAFVFLQGADLAEAKDPDYPTKPITFYINYSGGGTEVATRAILEATAKHLGQPFISVIKTGGAGTVGAMAVMNSKPDGYTLGVTVGSLLTMLPHTEECPYKDLNGFTLVMNFAKFNWPLIVKGDAPWNTWKEFIEWAKQNPRAAKIGITGARSMSAQAIGMWQVEKKEKAEFTFVVFKGGGEILSASLGGHITMSASSMDPSTMGYVKEGKLRILAFLSAEKIPGYENIPSSQELYGFVPPAFFGVWGPRGIPEQALEKLDEAFSKGVRDPKFIEVMDRMHTPIVYMDRKRFNKEVMEAFPKVGEIIKILRAEEAREKK